MKKNTILYFLLFLLFSISSYSKECFQKIVCLNSMALIEKMPEFSIVQKELNRMSKIHENNLEKLAKEFHKKAEKYQKNKNTMLKKELELLQIKAHAYQKTASDDLIKKQNKLLNPIYKKIENAINKVLDKDKKIMRVDDCSLGKGVLVNKGEDITEKVKKELGLH
ncbi:OmpH family outer membrane protein [Blattabacterium cuenoti]|uniref:OmpH family outer membrane protein n=1 Tax=Blattabacterium cuenoti TaxID=1653831 RepID=UPI00163BCF9B|nr:OmpH family outer membrane protein [Blattabacterium cuenoti]